MHTVDQVAFRRAHIKVEVAFRFHKAWQAVNIVYFLNGQDRQAAGVGGHARRTFSECKKYTFRTAS